MKFSRENIEFQVFSKIFLKQFTLQIFSFKWRFGKWTIEEKKLNVLGRLKSVQTADKDACLLIELQR